MKIEKLKTILGRMNNLDRGVRYGNDPIPEAELSFILHKNK